MIERENSVLAVSQQCRLLAVSRSAVYLKPAAVSAEDLAVMALIDRQYCASPASRASSESGEMLAFAYIPTGAAANKGIDINRVKSKIVIPASA